MESISFVAAASQQERAELERRLRKLVAARGGRIGFRYTADVYVSRAV
jgi:hypothetical protein